jgi:hypothetical protein
LLDLGKVTVSGADLAANFALPATVRLTGTLQVPQVKGFCTFSYASVSTAAASQTSLASGGGFQMLLTTGRRYRFSATLTVAEMGAAPSYTENGDCTFASEGTLTFFGREVVLTSDAIEGLDIPALPDFVTIYGRVTDRTGEGVRASVSAEGTPLRMGTAATFLVRGETDHRGYYRLLVPSGIDYELSFNPSAGSP